LFFSHGAVFIIDCSHALFIQSFGACESTIVITVFPNGDVGQSPYLSSCRNGA